MLVTFQSTATPDVIMLRNLAQYLLSLMGKHLNARGVIVRDEMPDAIARLEAAISEQTHAADTLGSPHSVPNGHHHIADDDRRALSHRAWPLLDMMREAHKQNADILWGL